MYIEKIAIHQFTVFNEAEFSFSKGLNVLIGENGTGKSQLLKLLYVIHQAIRLHKGGLFDPVLPSAASLNEALVGMLQGVFQPDHVGRLVRRGRGRRSAEVVLTWPSAQLSFTLSSLGKVTVSTQGELSGLESSVFLPTREVISIFPGFIHAYQNKESSFDRTYYDLCVALSGNLLRGARGAALTRLLAPVEKALGGKVVSENGRFYLTLQDGKMEAPLVAEGLRKLATMAYLLANGSLVENGMLFWDEPEANMNPRMVQLNRDVLLGLADGGMQVFMATHDYLLASELSLQVEHKRAETAARFFVLGRSEAQEGVVVEAASTFTALQNNPILEEFSAHYDRESALLYPSKEEL